MKKVGPKEICGAVTALGLLACLLIYLFVYNDYTEKTDALKASNRQLQVEVDNLKQYYDKIPFYNASMAEMKATIEEITADYPGDAKEEDVIMMAVKMQEVALINVDKINIAAAKAIHTVPEDVVKGLKDENLTTAIDFNARQATYDCLTDYGNFKAAVEKVYDDKYRIGINSVSFKKDNEDNNFIKGTIDITYYSLAGMNKEYVKPDMADYLSGTMDLFPAHIERDQSGSED